MYIPSSLHVTGASPGSPRSAADVDGGGGAPAQLHTWLRRQFSSNGSENKNIQIGIALGVILGAFLIAAVAFLYIYRGSVKCTKRKKRRGHHKSASSRSSRSSKNSDEGAAPPPPEA